MNEQLSCWVDGELDDLAAGRILRSLKQEDSVQQDAELAYLIGDAIRGEMSLGAGFMGRFSEALQAEPTVIAPGAAAGKKAEHVNRRVFALSAAASVAAFMVVGWFAARTGSMVAPGAAGPAAVARLEVPAKAASAEANRMQQYMAMHQELSSYQAIAFNTAGQ
ncbi:MAG: sigma-E factor negative regulatory protein [Chitinivorax sp.]